MTDFANGKTPVRSEFADDEDFRELLQLFAESVPEKQGTLRALHQKGAVEEIRVCAHQIKGAGGGYGFPGLSSAAADLEHACKAHDADRIARTLDALVDYLGRIDATC